MVGQFVTRLSRERSLTIAEVEALPIEDALAQPKEPIRPVWDSKSSVLIAGEWRGTVRSNGTTLVAILDAFESAGWPEVAVPMETIRSAADRKKCIGRFLASAPIEIRPNGTGKGMVWSWKSPS